MIGQIISNYEVKSLLGAGGMANVYLAQHQSLGNNVAIKLLKDEFVQHPNIRKRFLAEARNLAKMHHPNVIKVTDLIDAGDIVAFVMEHVAGDSLEDYISKNAPLANVVIENLFNQMIDAIEYVHSQGLIHRDIKPSNFMVTQEGSIKLLDFGIAKNLNDGAVDYTKTSMAQQMGTPMYMSPEQVRNTAEITEKSDVYSLGVVLWQMVMNKKPYNSVVLTLPEIQVAIMKDQLPLTNTIWDSTIKEATAKVPAKRSLKINAKKGVESISVSDTEIDPLIPKQNPKKEKLEKKTYFNVKTISIGVGILLFIGLLVISLSKGEKLDSTVATNPEDTTTETSLPTEKAEEPVSKKDKTRLPEDQETTNKNIPEEKKEEPKQFPFEKEQQKEDVKVAPIESSTKLKIGQKYQGGIIFYIDNSGKHGKVCLENDLGHFEWEDAINKCVNLSINGYSDWYLPSKSELNFIYMQRNTIGVFYEEYYWSSTKNYVVDAWAQSFFAGEQGSFNYNYKYKVRAIRSF
jgi:serine/threonine protein kinase